MSIDPTPSFTRQLAVSAAFMVALRFAFRAIGLISTLILVRLLGPAEFGIVALAMVTFATLESVSDMSFDKALIRMRDPQAVHFNTAWTLTIMRGFLIAIILVISGPFLAAFVEEPEVTPICYAIAVIAIGQSFQNNGIINYQREFQYDKIFKFQLAAKLVGFVVTVTAALLLRNFWALVIGTATAKLVLVPLSYAMHPFRPKFSLAVWKDLLNFSKWLLVSNLQAVIESYSVTLVLGKIGGPTAIGLYQVSNEIGTLPASEVAAPIRQPLYVGYTRHANDMPALRQQYIGGWALTVALLIPACAGISLMSNPITTLFLGAKWMDAEPIIALCALLGLFDSISHYTYDVFTALHKQGKFARLYTVALAIRFPSIIIGAYLDGVEGAVVGLVMSATFNMVFLNIHISRMIGLRFGDYARCSWRSIAAVCVMAPVVWWLSVIWAAPPDTLSALVRFLALCACGAVVHIGVLFFLWRLSGSPPGPEANILNGVRKGLEIGLNLVASKAPEKT